MPPQKGDQIKRFEQVPTSFTSNTENNQLQSEITTGLPQLNWLAENSSTQPLLSFELTNNLLTVKNSSGTALKNYQIVDGQLTASTRLPARNQNFVVDADPAKNKGFLNKTVNSLIDSVGLGSNEKGLPGQVGIIRNQQALKNQGIWMSQNITGEPTGLAVADLDGDGQLETLVAMRNDLLIFQINEGKAIEEAKIELPTGSEILSADVIDLDQDGKVEIYLSASKDEQLVSRVLTYSAGSYQTTISYIPWFLRVAELPGEGRVLLGQSTGDKSEPFRGRPFRILPDAGQLAKGEELPLSVHVNLFSFLPFSANSGGQPIAYVTQEDYLMVLSGDGQELWESADYFGGTETSFYNTVDQGEELLDPIYIQKRIINGPEGEILVAQNDGLRVLRRFRKFKDSRVVALTWNGFAMQESWRTSGLNGYLADFALADADNDGLEELVMVVKFKHKTVLQDARSAIVIYELN